MTNYAGASLDEQIKKLLEENLEYSRAVYSETLKIKRYILWGRVMSLLQLLIVLIPIILGIIYLPPLIQNFVGSFSVFGSGQDVPAASGGLNSILDQYKEVLNIYK